MLTLQQIQSIVGEFNLGTQQSVCDPNIVYLITIPDKSIIGDIELDTKRVHSHYNEKDKNLLTAETVASIKKALEKSKRSMYTPFDFEAAVKSMDTRDDDSAMRETRELVISKVHQVPAPYQSMYILEQTDGFTGGFVIYGISRVTGKNPEYYLVANTLKNFVDAFLTFDEAEYLVLNYQKAASEVQMNVQVTTPAMGQEELEQLKNLLNKARSILDSSEANVFVCLDEELGELVLFGECNREGGYRTISSQGVSDDFM
jgi:hypothetical protein